MADLNPIFVALGFFIGLVIGAIFLIEPIEKLVDWIADRIWK